MHPILSSSLPRRPCVHRKHARRAIRVSLIVRINWKSEHLAQLMNSHRTSRDEYVQYVRRKIGCLPYATYRCPTVLNSFGDVNRTAMVRSRIYAPQSMIDELCSIRIIQKFVEMKNINFWNKQKWLQIWKRFGFFCIELSISTITTQSDFLWVTAFGNSQQHHIEWETLEELLGSREPDQTQH